MVSDFCLDMERFSASGQRWLTLKEHFSVLVLDTVLTETLDISLNCQMAMEQHKTIKRTISNLAALATISVDQQRNCRGLCGTSFNEASLRDRIIKT